MRTAYAVSLTLLAGLLPACAHQQGGPTTTQRSLADCSDMAAHAEALDVLYGPGRITAVEPKHRKVFRARAVQYTYVSGADVYVAAQPGMNRAYVERALTCHALSGRSASANDPLVANGVRSVSVSDAGPSMRVSIVGADRAAGRAIFNRAQAMHAHGSVEVQQLSQLEHAPEL